MRVTESVRVTETKSVEVNADRARNSTTEAMISGQMSFDDIRSRVSKALRLRLAASLDPEACSWAYVTDISDAEVVFEDDRCRLWQCVYQLSGEEVTLGEPVEVVRTYAPAPVSAAPAPAAETTETTARAVHDVFGARVLEAKGKTKDGGRIFAVQVIAYGDSKNGRRYTRPVLEAAAPLYEGAKSFDHHRTVEEMRTGTIEGLVGYLRNPSATETGLQADLHLLPSATKAAEALDVALELRQEGADPFVGISHDVYATFRSIQENGRHIQEATGITSVNSADIVSTPAAGGQATRVVAGGVNPDDPAGAVPTGESTEEPDVPATKADVLAAFKEATDDELAAVGLARASSDESKSTETKATETTETKVDPPAEKATEAAPGEPKGSFLGKMLIREKVKDADLPASFVESLTAALPDRINESDVDGQIAAIKTMIGSVERSGLTPSMTPKVTKESADKKAAALDAMFAGDYSKGYRSFREAYIDFTGARPRALDEDFNRTILRETFGEGFMSSQRSTESMNTASWDVVLGDSVTRRMIAEYGRPSLRTWDQVVSSTTAVNDFRTQRLERVGGYGVLPAVAQGASYTALTSPTDEEATYAITKRGGTEDLTLEMIANDDLRAIQRIPAKLGLAAAQTLYRFVWDTLPTNAVTSYDAVALFAAGHNNTDNPALLGQSTLSAARAKMRKQTAYGDASDVLSVIPKYLVVPSGLEELAYQLCTSAVAIPGTPAGPTDTPNIHQGLNYIVVDYFTDANDWFLVCDPGLCPTIELGFYQGRQDPELFTQADQSVGSMFNADKLTYKIRHIYSGTVVDHRGFYRGANA